MVIVSWNYRITLPLEVRRKLEIGAGDELVFDEEDGKIFIMKAEDRGNLSDSDELEKELIKKYS